MAEHYIVNANEEAPPCPRCKVIGDVLVEQDREGVILVCASCGLSASITPAAVRAIQNGETEDLEIEGKL